MSDFVVLNLAETKGQGFLPDWLRFHAAEIARGGAGGVASVADDMRYIADQIESRTHRPLIVIDPEDREQAKRMDDLYLSDERDSNHCTVDMMQAALREFANSTPPKPDEPTGLGAVVEDADGERYVRHGSAELDDSVVWCNSVGVGRSYARINAVRVLSEGVRDE